MVYTQHMYNIMREAYEKLGEMTSAFSIPKYSSSMTDIQVANYIGNAFKDSFREFGFTVNGFETECPEMSMKEMYFINRICYRMMYKFRFEVVLYNKFASSNDGFSVDKSKVYDNFNDLLEQLDKEYKDYVYGNYHHGVLTWNARPYEWAGGVHGWHI